MTTQQIIVDMSLMDTGHTEYKIHKADGSQDFPVYIYHSDWEEEWVVFDRTATRDSERKAVRAYTAEGEALADALHTVRDNA
jgi:hypothetical protein